MNKKAILSPLLLLGFIYAVAASAEDVLIETIPQKELLSYLSEGVNFTLIDARSAQEYQAGHVHGAVNIPHDAELSLVKSLGVDSDSALVIYCKSGLRAFKLQRRLEALGYSNVRVLSPAQMMWADELPVFNCGNVPSEPFRLTAADSELLEQEGK